MLSTAKLLSISAIVLACMAPLSHAARPALLPIDPGTYVVSSTSPCEDAPLANVVRFDGQSLAGPHEAECKSKLLSHHGRTYKFSSTCGAAGDGTPAKPYTQVRTIRVESRDHFSMVDGGKSIGYGLCAAFH